MKIINWEFESLKIKMIELNGELYCTSKSVREALSVEASTLRQIYRRHEDEFFSICVTDCHANLQMLKNTLGLKYIRKDMKLWSEDDMLTFAFMVSGDRARAARRDFRKFIKEHAKKGLVSKGELEQLKEDLRAEMQAEVKSAVKKEHEKLNTLSRGIKSTMGRVNNIPNRINNVIAGDFGRTA